MPHAATLRWATSAIAAALVGCAATKEETRFDPNALPNLPNAVATVEAGSVVKFHEVRVTVREAEGEGDDASIRYAVKRGETIEDAFEIAPSRWALHGDVLLRFEPVRDVRGRELLNLYHLPSLSRGGREPMPAQVVRLQEGRHLFFDGGFLALDRVRGNDPARNDDERAEVTLLLGGTIREVAVPEFGSADAGDAVLRADNVYPGDRAGEGIAFLRIAAPGDRWAEASEVEQLRLPSGESVARPGLEIRTDTLEGEAGWRALVSLRTSTLRRDIIVSPGESVRAGSAELLVKAADAESIDAELAEYAVAALPENAHYPGAVPAEETAKPGDVRKEPTKSSKRLIVGQSAEFWDARFEFVGLLANDPTDMYDDTAEFLVHRDGTSERLYARKGHRNTIRGINRWWVVDVKSIAAGRPGECEIVLETGSFLGAQNRQSQAFP